MTLIDLGHSLIRSDHTNWNISMAFHVFFCLGLHIHNCWKQTSNRNVTKCKR